MLPQEGAQGEGAAFTRGGARVAYAAVARFPGSFADALHLLLVVRACSLAPCVAVFRDDRAADTAHCSAPVPEASGPLVDDGGEQGASPIWVWRRRWAAIAGGGQRLPATVASDRVRGGGVG